MSTIMERNKNSMHGSKRSSFGSSNMLNNFSSFCSAENLPQRLAFLDKELSVYGYPSIQQNNSLNQVILVNVTYDLLQNYRKVLEAHSDTTDDLRNFESDAARTQHLLSLAREDIANKDRELKSKCIEEAHLQQRIDSLRKKYKTEQDKCRRMSADLASRDSQYKHEKKKKLQEVERLQAKLHQLLQDKRHERLLGIELLNSLQRTDGKRGKWNTDKTKKSHEQDMYRLIITNYEDSQRQLLSENADMRKYLKQMQDELIAALNEKALHSDRRSSVGSLFRETTSTSRRESLESEKTTTSEESELSIPMSEGVFEMPYHLVKEDIEKSLRSKWKALRKMHKQRNKSDEIGKRTDLNSSMSSQKFVECQKVIKEQQDLIEYLTSGQDDKKNSFPTDAYFLEEKAELEKTKLTFNQQRQALDKEREMYAEALIKLEQDRQTFEEDKAKWFQNKFLQLTPFQGKSTTNKRTPSSTKNYRRKGLSSSWNESINLNFDDTSPLLTSRGEADGLGNSQGSPSVTKKSPNLRHYYSSPDDINPWSGNSPPVPSTCQLYKALGLRYHGKENQESPSFACSTTQLTRQLTRRVDSTSQGQRMYQSETNLHSVVTPDHMTVSTSCDRLSEQLALYLFKKIEGVPCRSSVVTEITKSQSSVELYRRASEVGSSQSTHDVIINASLSSAASEIKDVSESSQSESDYYLP